MQKLLPSYILKVLKGVRIESKIASKQLPKIEDVIQDSNNNILYIIVSDRPDRSALIGYGGLIIKKIKREINVNEVTVIAKTDLLIKRKRISETIMKAKAIMKRRKIPQDIKEFLEILIEQLRLEKKFPPRIITEREKAKNIKVLVAYSGGVDSTAALVLLKNMGFNVKAVTVDPGPFILPNWVRDNIAKAIKLLSIEHEFIKPIVDFHEIIEHAKEGTHMPCSLCYPVLTSSVYMHAVENGINIVAFGDLISTSKYSLDFPLRKKFLLRVNLPGALALTKHDTKLLSKGIVDWKPLYGCPLLRNSMKNHRWMRYIAIERVLREVRAGILEPMDGLRYIKSILKLVGK